VVTHQPDWVLNASAYTAVDRAEAEPELAHAVNAGAPLVLAKALSEFCSASRFLQISTDFVFSGTQGHPYRPEQELEPLGVYGVSKAAGEKAVAAEVLACAAPVEPISTADYPTPARRPPYSLLDSSATRAQLGLQPQHWR